MTEEMGDEYSVWAKRELKALQVTASGGVASLIKAGQVFSSEEFLRRITDTKARVRALLPNACPTKERLAHTYAVDLVSTFVVSD